MFRWMALAAAAGGAALAALAAWLSRPQAFDGVLRMIASRYSPDGQITPAGVAIITRSLELVGWAAGLAAAAGLVVAVCLARILRTDASDGPTAARMPSLPGWWAAGMIALVAAAAAVRIPGLFTSLVYDEIFSVQHFATQPLALIPVIQEGFNNHILNSLLLHAVLQVSSAEALLRVPVLAAGLASIVLCFLVGRRLGGNVAGLFAAWLAVTSPYHVLYSTLARGYMLGLCFTLLGLWALVEAGSPPRPRSLWLFGAAQVAASLAMPTTIMTSLVLAASLLLATFGPVRKLLGLDPGSPTGSAWLAASLGAVSVSALLNLPMIPYVLRLLAEAQMLALGGALAGAASWFGVTQRGAVPALAGVGVVVLGAAVLLARARQPGAWQPRVLAVLWAVTIATFLTGGYPARIQVIAFLGFVFLAAFGLAALVEAAVRLAAGRGRPLAVSGACAAVVILAVAASSWPELVLAARGASRQDVRGAVRLAESMLPAEGAILTSGFSNREIGYYAARPVRLLSPQDDPAQMVDASADFCYFKLFASVSEADPVFAYVGERFGPPVVTVSGVDDPIVLWCVVNGELVRSQAGDDAAPRA